jgi:hypothetical protein
VGVSIAKAVEAEVEQNYAGGRTCRTCSVKGFILQAQGSRVRARGGYAEDHSGRFDSR